MCGSLLRFVNRHPAPATIFGGITGDISLRHHFCRLMIVVINQGNPGTGTYPMYTSFPDKVIVIHGADNACSDKTRTFDITIWQQQTKFIPTESRQHVAGAQHTQHQRRQFAQQSVTRRMPGAVIHRFKAIKIDKHQGMSLMCTVYRLQQDTQLFLKTGAVGEMRQCIMGGAVAQLAQHFA